MPFDRIPKGSLILVTGATGLIGSAVVDAAITYGFKVRGVTRSVSKAAQFVKHLEDKYGKESFEIIEVKDFNVPGAYDEILHGVAGVLHLASDLSMAPSYDVVVGSVVESTVGLMKAAAEVPSVKSFVLTSSRMAIFAPDYEKPDISPKLNEWGDHFVTMAKEHQKIIRSAFNLPQDAASKVEGERAAFKYYNSALPSYAFNTVLPDLVVGPIFNPTPGIIYSSHTFLNGLFLSEQKLPILNFVRPASLAVDVRDVASIHLAALLSTQTEGKRIWAAAHRFEVNDILKIWREAFPERTFVEDFKLPPQPKITLELAQSEELLEGLEGRGWLPFKESVIANVQDAL
ncbi:hypothetical protein K438DRAFT_1965692 [Mycena galopus ATCC 62051]|nr:hypothetical protein K438DRAFT_1965692 [Mycena galopus ATCC 62051]